MIVFQKNKKEMFQNRRFIFDIDYSLLEKGGIIVIEQGEYYTHRKNILTSLVVDQIAMSLGRFTKNVKIFNFEKNKEFPMYIINNFPATQLQMVICEDPVFHIYSPKIKNHNLAINTISEAIHSKIVIIFVIRQIKNLPIKIKNKIDILISLKNKK